MFREMYVLNLLVYVLS